MDRDSRDSTSKRALEAKEDVVEGESKEKRPRIASDISEVSEQDENVVVEEPGENSPTVVVYELSSDNDESLLNASEKRSSNEISPVRSENNVEAEQEKDEENDTKMKSESEEEETEEEEDSEESSESEDSGEDEEDDKSRDVDDEEHGKAKERVTDKDKRSEDKKTAVGVEQLSSEDESDGEAADRKQSVVIDISSDAMHESDADNKQDSSGTRRKESIEAKEKKAFQSSVDGAPKSSKEIAQEKRKRLESSDYNTKSMEALEDLQEDLHKELAEITGKVLQKRKSKKASSSSHRDKRHKEKSTSRHKEKERLKEKDERGGEGDEKVREKDRPKEREKEKQKERERGKEKQRSTESRGDFRREVTVGARKEHDKGRKYHEVDDKPWSYESRRARPLKDEEKDRGGDSRHWMQTRLERPASRTEMKSVVERKVRKDPKASKEEESRAKETKPTDTAKEAAGKEPVKKGIMSDSMRELVRQSIKENKGLAQEVVEEESDESPEHFFKVQTSDVSSASESEEEPAERESSPEVPKLPPYLPAIQGCRSVEEFQWLNRIEEGTYGVVYRAKDKRTGEVVALKKLKMEKEKEGFPITSLREINTLLKAQHPNIVTVQEIVVGSNMDKIYIVMDFVEHDLKALMETMTQSFLAGEIKTIMIQLLRAVNHLHDNWILHRDIKTSNLLLSNKGILKVGDFGLAREYGSPLKPYTPVVVTLWYRAPELLLGAKEYSTPIDVWSVGCVFAELLTMKPLFNGQSEISQINKIFKELGTPSDKIWPGPPAYSELPATKKMTFAEYPYNNLRNKFGATLTDNGFDLLNSFLTYDPNRRITAEDALKHEYFKESPSPVDPSLFPSWPARSEGAKRAKKASPKAPEGGNFYKSLSGDGDGVFHIPVGKSQGKTAVPGFTLKF